MTRAAVDLLRELMALHAEDRAEIAAELLASIDDDRAHDWDGAWLAEIDRRAADVATPTVLWDDVRTRVLAAIRKPA